MSKQTDKNGMNKMQTINRKRPRTYLVIGFAAAILLVIVSVGIFMLAKKDAGEPQTIDAEGYVTVASYGENSLMPVTVEFEYE